MELSAIVLKRVQIGSVLCVGPIKLTLDFGYFCSETQIFNPIFSEKKIFFFLENDGIFQLLKILASLFHYSAHWHNLCELSSIQLEN